ncbi:hypothetical protein [Methanobrevibacter sp.]|uniref:hypothetical protein n=1 Tax=Methanobrevibacter sp. TaxID=66852 RepID=UPI00388CF24D
MNDSEQKDSIEELVDYMVLEDNNFPFDFSFRLIDDRYPESTHQCLNFPGIFVKPLETEVFTDDGINLRMDAAHLVLPDDTIPQKSAEGIEHQSNRLDFKKIDAIYDYKVGLIHNNNLPAISVVVTNIDYELSEIIFESHGDAFKIYFKILDDDEIYERLNTLKI